MRVFCARFILVIGICNLLVQALPTRPDGDSEESQEEVNEDDNRLRFESNQDSGESTSEEDVSQKEAQLLKQAEIGHIARDAPEEHGEIGSKTGEEVAHGDEESKQGEEEAIKEVKHVNTGALSDDFVHNMMHDGNEDHDDEDDEMRKEKAVEYKDLPKMEFSEDELKNFDKESLESEGATYDDQEHGPAQPNKALHGVLMHGDEEAGEDHAHDDEQKDEPITDEPSVMVQEVGQAGEESSEGEETPGAPPLTVDAEQLMHGEGEDHKHGEVKDRKPKKEGTDTVITENFMHDLMHGNTEDHDHDDAELKKSKAVRPRDLLNLGLDKSLLKGLDLNKMIQDDMEDYNKFMSENGGEEESVWNIFNSFQFRYFKYGEDIDDISSRQPPEEEWDHSMISRPDRQEGEDFTEHVLELAGSDVPLSDVHSSKHRRDYDEDAIEET